MDSFLIDVKSKALRTARIGSVASGLVALYLIYCLLRMLVSLSIEAADPDFNVEMLGYVLTDVWLFTFMLMAIFMFWTWRLFTGKGAISCVLLIFFFGEPVLSSVQAGGSVLEHLLEVTLIFVFFVFGLRGTVSYRRLPPVPKNIIFD